MIPPASPPPLLRGEGGDLNSPHHQGINSPPNNSSRFKPTQILIVSYQGINSPANNSSRFKPTQRLIVSPQHQGINSLANNRSRFKPTQR
ncbi:hypothetical protein WN50_25890 [Limnoraphis robusta CS-951]|uniref:Uncharacterized protein n=1 Tax=Limnoraphis robusta CS-951 TaxID=1637645 RepID=A0A0F5Y9L7_9CYAN|nr:hypothetical protein WN50_25890 [Limnoraphis robusta CS-951]